MCSLSNLKKKIQIITIILESENKNNRKNLSGIYYCNMCATNENHFKMNLIHVARNGFDLMFYWMLMLTFLWKLNARVHQFIRKILFICNLIWICNNVGFERKKKSKIRTSLFFSKVYFHINTIVTCIVYTTQTHLFQLFFLFIVVLHRFHSFEKVGHSISVFWT